MTSRKLARVRNAVDLRRGQLIGLGVVPKAAVNQQLYAGTGEQRALYTAESDPCCDYFWRSFAP